jgi:hypothetical protein
VDREGALAAAKASEARWQNGAPIDLIDGLGTTIKDNVWLKGFPSRRGSLTSDPAPMKEDAPSVARLREAGAVILGKTTLPEFGWIGVCHSPLTGITRNPWKLDHTPGGSSGGAAGRGPAQSRAPASRHRRRRLGPHPGGIHRRIRHQAELRPRAGLSGFPVQHFGASGPADAKRERRRADAQRDRKAGRARHDGVEFSSAGFPRRP